MAGDRSTSEAYADVPYPGRPFPQSHPDRLATLARLHGLAAPAPAACRVLEIGSGDGGNLLPMAAALPNSSFVGIDVSGRAVDIAKARAQATGLENARFEELSLADFEPPAASFDYVIAHGVYSWVDEPLRDALVALTARALAPNGVAYISYNTLPGGAMRALLREILLEHVKHVADPAQQLVAARELLDVLQVAWGYDEELRTLRYLAQKTRESPDALLYHDALSPVNERMRFADFTAHAARHGLQFLAEANFWEMQVGWLPHEMRDAVFATRDRLQREALVDVLRLRSFRQTLLCHAAHELDETPAPGRLQTLAVASRAEATAGDDGRVTFTAPSGANLTTDHALVVDALRQTAAAFPDAPAVADLFAADAEPEERSVVCEALLRCYGAALVELRATPLACGRSSDPLPQTTALVRLQAREGALVTNLRHEPVELDDRARLLVSLVDGTRDRAQLLELLADAAEGRADRDTIAAWLDEGLEGLAGQALLVAPGHGPGPR